MVHCVGRVECYDATCLKPFVIYNVLNHLLGIVVEFLGFNTDCLVVEDLGVGSVWVLASDLPGLEEWVPIEIREELFKVVFKEYFGSEEGRLDDVHA